MLTKYWYKNAIIYSLDVKTFADSDGDGIGDLQGLMQNLDYLACLGINCIWLQPMHPSPLKDGGYDITDHFTIDRRLGTLAEFTQLVDKANARGIRIMMDLVLNHTSAEHPWFRDARQHKHGKYRDYYIWADERPANHDAHVVFKGVETSNWAYDTLSQSWFYHTFYHFQPDLNVFNPAVEEEIKKIILFWIRLGVNGFRIDAVPHMLRAKGQPGREGDPHDLLRRLRRFTDEHGKDIVLMGEADTEHESYDDFFGNRDQLHMLLNFHVNNHLFLALARKQSAPLCESLDELMPHSAVCNQFANFVRNHDELNLAQLEPGQQEDVLAAFAPDPDMRVYERGIRRRLPPMLNNDEHCIKLTYSLLFSMPGTPVLRYGEEIGMGDLLTLKERASVRTAMQWTDARHGGFSGSEGWVWPLVTEGPYSYMKVNVAAQANRPHSLLNTISNMIAIRKAYPAFGWGEYEIVETGHPGVLAHICRSENTLAMALHNFTGEACRVELPLSEEDKRCLTEILADRPYELPNGSFELGPYGYRWLYKWPLVQKL
ncbi:alpha-amylase family protein [Chitinophaga horti]|uniref:Alpha-amylase n=1 Tax=Chitinophaga horti TaxID=2920382 RepID=A0ABY6J735_9BACT|nr:alpha-amylase family protein [Chitinophaga horti]UYQ95495.1 alpha-amylase family protein [Chitinophaga horti]